MEKRTIIIVIGAAVVIALILVFSKNNGTPLFGATSTSGVSGTGNSFVNGALIRPSSPSAQPILAGVFSGISSSISRLIGPAGANAQAAQVGSALQSVQAGGGYGNSSGLAAALNAPLEPPVQSITPQIITDEYSSPASPPSIVGWDDSSVGIVTPVPDTGAIAFDSPGLPGDVVSSS